MIYNKFSRRYFLRGAGGALMLPFLPSIMRNAYAAGEPGTRYIQVISAYGQFQKYFIPASGGMVAQAGGIMAKPLSSIAGDISYVMGPAFNPFKNRLSIIRGTHVLAGHNQHNGCQPTCASSTPEDNYSNGKPVFPYSIDAVLSESAKIYPSATGLQRLVVFCPTPYKSPTYSWNKVNGSIQHISYTSSTSSLLAKFTQLTGTPPASDPVVARKTDVLQGVFEDYKAVRDSGKLSAADKMRFESYISLIDEVQKGLASTTPSAGVCTRPAQEAEPNQDAIYRNQANILVAAMACQLTRVASMSIDFDYAVIHDMSHASRDSAQAKSHADYQKLAGERYTYLLSQMEKVIEPGGTMLDNSMVYWGNEFGENTNGPHVANNMNVVVAGSAGGRLQTGYYIDYNLTGGMPFNNFLVTMFNAMGLTSADYQRGGIVGFGEYDSGAISARGLASKTSNAERIKALPFYYKGPIMG